jgi:hypothetical protein
MPLAPLTRRSTIADVAAGGACASIYSAGAYQSHDLDFIIRSGGTRRALDAAMALVGFIRDHDRYVNPSTAFYVEFPRGPLSIGDDAEIRPIDLKVGGGRTLALSATDACRDRLAAFYHWSDRQSLNAAVAIARRRRVSMAAIERWSTAEGQREKFEEFRAAVSRRRKPDKG